MFYCKDRHAYIDRDTGQVVIVLDPSEPPPTSNGLRVEENPMARTADFLNQNAPPPPPPTFHSSPQRSPRQHQNQHGKSEESPMERADRLLAEQLSREAEMTYVMPQPTSSSGLSRYGHYAGTIASSSGTGSMGVRPIINDDIEGRYNGGDSSRATSDILGQRQHPPQQHSSSFLNDWSLARALQAMEFEIEAETLGERQRYEQEEEQDRDFTRKEYGASSCRRQMLTFSTFVCVAQICIMITMCSWDGMAPQSQNPMYGPPATTMVRFGAKDTSLILYKKQWWRLFSPIMLHAGVIHLISNVLIQLRVGGYLNLVFGNVKWIWIYLVSGVFGNVCSCCFIPDSVGVGSSGALLGMLTAWIVWIIFRWKKIPQQCRNQRNCQLGMVFASVAITLGMSFSQYVDWGAHFGGAIMGILWGVILLSTELDNKFNARILQLISVAISIGLWVGALYYMCVELHPSRANWIVYQQNDDWHHHNKQSE